MNYKIHIPRWNELPNVDLYLDQVVTLLNTSLSSFLFLNAEKEDNQILTKTMINNYVKNKLIEAPSKKKYSKNQLAKLFVICVLKQVYSMVDISQLIHIALESTNIEIAYNSFCNEFEEALLSTYKKDDFSINTNTADNKYLLKSVLLSCTYKIYVQNIINTKK